MQFVFYLMLDSLRGSSAKAAYLTFHLLWMVRNW